MGDPGRDVKPRRILVAGPDSLATVVMIVNESAVRVAGYTKMSEFGKKATVPHTVEGLREVEKARKYRSTGVSFGHDMVEQPSKLKLSAVI